MTCDFVGLWRADGLDKLGFRLLAAWCGQRGYVKKETAAWRPRQSVSDTMWFRFGEIRRPASKVTKVSRDKWVSRCMVGVPVLSSSSS
eukprot:3758194-Amphidinium_carterae.1